MLKGKKKNYPRILYSVKSYFKSEGEIKTKLTNKNKFTEFAASTPALQQVLNSWEGKVYKSEIQKYIKKRIS